MKKFYPCFMPLAAIFCLLLFFSCTSDIESMKYCVYPEMRQCFSTTQTICTTGGELSDFCPYSSSSSGGWSYRTKLIGDQVWMAENLNYNASGSKCYGNSESNCAIYGRLYDWATAMALPLSCNSNSCSSQISTKHKGVCPSGWHIPTNAEWDKLYRYVDGTSGASSPYESPTAGKYLKATSGWNSGGNGTDAFGFAALPGGYYNSEGSFLSAGIGGFWWSASENDSDYAYYRGVYDEDEYAYKGYYYKSYLYSVRCLQD